MRRHPKQIGVILMTYGSPATLDDIPQYLKNIYGGRTPKPEQIKEFRRRYKLIGGSPLIKHTQEQAQALQKELNTSIDNAVFTVTAGMRFSPPFIADVVKEFPKTTDKIVGIIMSPQYSPIIMSGYVKQLKEAVEKLHYTSVLTISEDWHTEKHFIEAIAKRVDEVLKKFPPSIRKTVPVLFSAHSMPKRVIEKEPDYINTLKETASLVAKKLKLPADQWMFCYQSAGHTPEEWLKPDFADIMPLLKKQGRKQVLIAPVQFLSDHLEVLYDIEIGAREQAEQHGIEFFRTQSLNTSTLFIKSLAEVVKDLL